MAARSSRALALAALVAAASAQNGTYVSVTTYANSSTTCAGSVNSTSAPAAYQGCISGALVGQSGAFALLTCTSSLAASVAVYSNSSCSGTPMTMTNITSLFGCSNSSGVYTYSTCVAAVTPAPTPSPTPSPTLTPSPSSSPTISMMSPSATISVSPSPSPSPATGSYLVTTTYANGSTTCAGPVNASSAPSSLQGCINGALIGQMGVYAMLTCTSSLTASAAVYGTSACSGSPLTTVNVSLGCSNSSGLWTTTTCMVAATPLPSPSKSPSPSPSPATGSYLVTTTYANGSTTCAGPVNASSAPSSLQGCINGALIGQMGVYAMLTCTSSLTASAAVYGTSACSGSPLTTVNVSLGCSNSSGLWTTTTCMVAATPSPSPSKSPSASPVVGTASPSPTVSLTSSVTPTISASASPPPYYAPYYVASYFYPSGSTCASQNALAPPASAAAGPGVTVNYTLSGCIPGALFGPAYAAFSAVLACTGQASNQTWSTAGAAQVFPNSGCTGTAILTETLTAANLGASLFGCQVYAGGTGSGGLYGSFTGQNVMSYCVPGLPPVASATPSVSPSYVPAPSGLPGLIGTLLMSMTGVPSTVYYNATVLGEVENAICSLLIANAPGDLLSAPGSITCTTQQVDDASGFVIYSAPQVGFPKPVTPSAAGAFYWVNLYLSANLQPLASTFGALAVQDAAYFGAPVAAALVAADPLHFNANFTINLIQTAYAGSVASPIPSGVPSMSPSGSPTPSVTPSGSLTPTSTLSMSNSPAPSVAVGATPSNTPSSIALAPQIAASPSAAPGTIAVPGALVFSNINIAAFAQPGAVALLAQAISSAISTVVPGSGPNVSITSIVDVATSVAIYTAAVHARRRLQAVGSGVQGSQGVNVNYAVLLSANSSSFAANITAAVTPSGGGSANFSSNVLRNIIATATGGAASSSNVGGYFIGATAAAAVPTATSVSSSSSSSSSTSQAGVGIGGFIAVVAGLLVIWAVYKYYSTGRLPCSAPPAPTGPKVLGSVNNAMPTSTASAASDEFARINPSNSSKGLVIRAPAAGERTKFAVSPVKS